MSEATVVNAEQARFWNEQADAWLDVEQAFEEFASGPGLAAMDLLGLEPGRRVLDIGCGGGPTTLELARRVGPPGEAVGLDISDELLRAARARAEAEGVVNAAFLHADAQTHRFEPASFDAAYSRFGVMFFDDLVGAFANIRGALRPGGTLAFVSWQSVFLNEWIIVPTIAAAQVLGSLPTPPAEGEPSPFSLSEPDRVREILTAAGFDDVGIVPSAEAVAVGEERIAQLAHNSMRLGAVREMVSEVDDDTRRQVAGAIEEALRDRMEDGVLRLTRAVLLVSARARD
jgi:ubiquinone/menaquinone biosynthesis C-methylase UbiE